MFTSYSRPLWFAVCLLLAAGCEKPTVDVNIHGVNYSDRPFTYFVSEIGNPEAGGGGEIIDSFGAGGVTCCVALPRKWQPGLKVRVRTRHWLPKKPDGELPEVEQEQLVEVPRYDGKAPGEIWVLRGEDGQISVISSDYQPDHPQWPGKVKGWPEPSLEYRRERWEIYRKHEEGGVKLFQQLVDELEKSPDTTAKDDWDDRMKYDKSSVAEFSGPNDPRYREWLKQKYKENLQYAQAKLNRLMEQRP